MEPAFAIHPGNATNKNMKLESLASGMVVYDSAMQRMGNTTLRSLAVWTVKVESVDIEGRFVVARWNHNAPRKFWANEFKRWSKKQPITIKNSIGQRRRATRAEQKAMQSSATNY